MEAEPGAPVPATPPKTILLSFGGSAGLYPVLLSASFPLMKMAQQVAEKTQCDIHFAGISGGCLAAVCLALGIESHAVVEKLFGAIALRMKPHNLSQDSLPMSSLYGQMHTALTELIGIEGYRKLNGRLHIGITVRDGWRARHKVISHFHSTHDAVECIVTSCHLFLLGVSIWRKFRGRNCCDGGWTASHVRLPGYRVVPIDWRDVKEYIRPKDWPVSLEMNKFHRLSVVGLQMVTQHQEKFRYMMEHDDIVQKNKHPEDDTPALDMGAWTVGAGVVSLALVSFIAVYVFDC